MQTITDPISGQVFNLVPVDLNAGQSTAASASRDQMDLSGYNPDAAGQVGVLVETVRFTSIAANGTQGKNFKNPVGTSLLRLVVFNPAIDSSLVLKISSAQKLPLDGFSTLIGNVGLFYLRYPVKYNDTLVLTYTNLSGVTQSPAFSFGFI